MLSHRHATILIYACPDFIPESPMRAGLMAAGLLGPSGELTSRGRKIARQALSAAEAKLWPPTSEAAQAWDSCQHDNFPPTSEIGDECQDCGATYEWLKKQE